MHIIFKNRKNDVRKSFLSHQTVLTKWSTTNAFVQHKFGWKIIFFNLKLRYDLFHSDANSFCNHAFIRKFFE